MSHPLQEFVRRGQAAQAAVDELTQDHLDAAIAEAAEREAEAQLAVIRALKPLNREGRERVVQAVLHVLEADARVPGILEAVARGLKR